MGKNKTQVKVHDTRMVPVDACEANAWNPNVQAPKTFSRLVEEIANTGFVEPIQVVPYEEGEETRYLIVGGEHRWKAAKVLGMTEIPAVLLTSKKFSEVDLQKALTIRLNAIKGDLDPERFMRLVQEFADKYGAEEVQSMFAVSDDDWKRLVKETKAGLKKAGAPKEILDKFDEEAKEATTLQDLGEIVQRLYAAYGDTVDKGYVVFSWGGKQHIYIQMDKRLKEGMDKIVKRCKETGLDINDVLAPGLCSLAEDL